VAFEVMIKLNTSGVKNFGAWERAHQGRHPPHEKHQKKVTGWEADALRIMINCVFC
jgi:hypothetical protein